MKKLIALFLCVTAIQLSARADNDRSISFEQLPTEAQQMIKKHFPNKSVALAKVERDFLEKNYEVIFTNGNKVEFDGKGVWEEIDCKYSEVPTDVVPIQIVNLVKTNYPNQKIIKIEKKRRNRHEIELSSGTELEFDANFNLIDIDD